MMITLFPTTHPSLMNDTSPSDDTNRTYVSDQVLGCVVILILGPNACCAVKCQAEVSVNGASET